MVCPDQCCTTQSWTTEPSSTPHNLLPTAVGSGGADSSVSVASYRAPSYRRLQPGEDGEGQPTFNVIAMEYCDRWPQGVCRWFDYPRL